MILQGFIWCERGELNPECLPGIIKLLILKEIEMPEMHKMWGVATFLLQCLFITEA